MIVRNAKKEAHILRNYLINQNEIIINNYLNTSIHNTIILFLTISIDYSHN